jgi:SPASM domain peptide maturase of grasp-with-spasm system
VPAHITNATIDVKDYDHDYNKILNELESLDCQYLQLRVYSGRSMTYFEELLQILENRRLISIEFLIQASKVINEESLRKLIDKYPRIHNIIVHSASENKIVHRDSSGMGNIIYLRQKIDSEAHCGMINTHYFTINLRTFSESQKHNTCLNRKISIDADGNIKNCPSMPKSYGNIRDTTLKEAIEKPGFKDVWYIHKDQIEICKDCEFRHICTDCRAYIQDPSNIYSKPAKCSYNPYTATWGDQNPTNNPLHGT